jgi:cell division protein FtsB
MADVLPGGLLLDEQGGLVCGSNKATVDAASGDKAEGDKETRLALLKAENERLKAHVAKLGDMLKERDGVLAQFNG